MYKCAKNNKLDFLNSLFMYHETILLKRGFFRIDDLLYQRSTSNNQKLVIGGIKCTKYMIMIEIVLKE